MTERRRLHINRLADGVWVTGPEDENIWFDRQEALDVAVELLRCSQPAVGWFPAVEPCPHRWRLVEVDALETIEFEDGFSIDRYACPAGIIFDRSHYRPDGSCRCPEEDK